MSSGFSRGDAPLPWQTQPIDLSKIAHRLPHSVGIVPDALIAGGLMLRWQDPRRHSPVIELVLALRRARKRVGVMPAEIVPVGHMERQQEKVRPRPCQLG